MSFLSEINTQNSMSFVAESHKEPGLMEHKYDFNMKSLALAEFKQVLAVLKGIQWGTDSRAVGAKS